MYTRGLILWGYSSWGMNVTTHLHLMPKSIMVELYLHSPIQFIAWYLIYYKDNFNTFTFTSWTLISGV
jgi:hypothetical protein